MNEIERIYKKHGLPIYDEDLKEAITKAMLESKTIFCNYGMSVVIWNNAKIMTQEEFSKWLVQPKEAKAQENQTALFNNCPLTECGCPDACKKQDGCIYDVQ